MSPRSGFTSVTVTTEVYEKIKEIMEEENKLAGWRKYRSVSQFVETVIMTTHKSVVESRSEKKK